MLMFGTHNYLKTYNLSCTVCYVLLNEDKKWYLHMIIVLLIVQLHDYNCMYRNLYRKRFLTYHFSLTFKLMYRNLYNFSVIFS